MEEYSIKQAAEILDCSTSTVRRRIKSSKLKAEKKKTSYGQQYFISKKELDKAITEKNIVDIQEVSRPISQEELKNTLVEAMENNYQDLLENINKSITNIQEQQDKSIRRYENKLERQSELIKNMEKELKQIKKKQNESIFAKFKKILFGNK